MPPRTSSATYPLAAILAASLFLSLWRVWEFMPSMDEMQFLIMSAGADWADVWHRSLAEIHPPLVVFIRHVLMLATTDIFPQRLLSAGAGLMAILGLFRLGVLLQGARLGLFCAAMMALLPSTLIASVSIRNYSFLLAFVSWALVFLLRWQREGHRRDMAAYCALVFAACATHFSCFLFSAACGLTEFLRLLRARRGRDLVVFCALHLPLLAFGLVVYAYFLAPGGTLPMWRHFMDVTGHPPPAPKSFSELSLFVVAYFFPCPGMAIDPDLKAQLPLIEPVMMTGGIVLMLLYIAGLFKMRRGAPDFFTLTASMWAVALLAFVTRIYPFTASRHNNYFLPFYIVPLGFLLAPPLGRMLQAPLCRILAALGLVLLIAGDETYLHREMDLAFTRADFDAAQEYLDAHLAPGDGVVTEYFGAYYYLLFAQDHGKTPYHVYGDVPYLHQSTILAPSGPPPRPYNSWHPFRDTLMRRLQQGTVQPQADVWFVNYGWKNIEIWTLMECPQARSLMDHFFSREGVLVFSIHAQALTSFLQDDAAWQRCYADYKPVLLARPIHAVAQP